MAKHQKSTAAHLDELKAKVGKAKAQLEEGLHKLQTSDDWRRTLELMALLGPTRISRFYAEHRIMWRDPLRSAVRRPEPSA